MTPARCALQHCAGRLTQVRCWQHSKHAPSFSGLVAFLYMGTGTKWHHFKERYHIVQFLELRSLLGQPG